jgi:hypothetical protein
MDIKYYEKKVTLFVIENRIYYDIAVPQWLLTLGYVMIHSGALFFIDIQLNCGT